MPAVLLKKRRGGLRHTDTAEGHVNAQVDVGAIQPRASAFRGHHELAEARKDPLPPRTFGGNVACDT